MEFPSRSPLELSRAEMEEMIRLTAARVVAHIETLPDQPALNLEGGAALAQSLIESTPTTGTPFPALLEQLFRDLIPVSFNTASPGYLAYIPAGGLYHSAIADFIASAVNRYVGVWEAAPALAQLEANVVRWFCDAVGYPSGARGYLSSGGSMANFTAVVTARKNMLPENFFAGTLYAGDQVHHSIMKAAALAGFPVANVRLVASDEQFRVRIDALEHAIRADRERGFQPFFVAGSAGTTNTGAVDDLAALASLAERERMWMHVDGAYGGFFALTERGRRRLAGIERAHSVTLDPHKSLFLPYGIGCLLVRDGAALRHAHTHSASYMPAMQNPDEFVDFCEVSPELSRAFRGLKAWLPLKMHGIGVFRDALDEKLDLATWATEQLRTIPNIEIVAEPQLSTLAFRLRPTGVDDQSLDALNRAFLDGINARKRVFLKGTVLNSRFTVRMCVLSFRTHLDRMKLAIEDIREAAAV